jgi:TPR repeat protein
MALGAIGEARDSKRGIEMLVSACYAGIDLDCAVAKQWLDALHHATDIPHGEDLAARMELQRVCLSGSAQQCYDLGILLDRGGPGLAPDGSHAVQALARGCNLGLAESCDGLADVLWYGRGVAQDRPRATAVYERACKLGLPNGCANVAFAMEFGAHSVKERTRALLLYGEACRAGSVYACFHVAMRDAQDRAGLRDPQAALARWSAACERGDAQACAFAGVMWEDGPDGQARDEEKSQSAMTRACDLHNDRACQWLGTAQEE